jgi:hypothetical protein
MSVVGNGREEEKRQRGGQRPRPLPEGGLEGGEIDDVGPGCRDRRPDVWPPRGGVVFFMRRHMSLRPH